MKHIPIYTSKSTAKSLWQEYRIYDDHLEFDTLLGEITIPFEEIEKVKISESEIKGLMKGDLHLKDFKPALKLDWANFVEHVVIDKSSGTIKRILITPDDIESFTNALELALSNYRKQ